MSLATHSPPIPRWYDLYTPDTRRRLAAALRQAIASASHLPSPPNAAFFGGVSFG